jgi:hypothetical protein
VASARLLLNKEDSVSHRQMRMVRHLVEHHFVAKWVTTLRRARATANTVIPSRSMRCRSPMINMAVVVTNSLLNKEGSNNLLNRVTVSSRSKIPTPNNGVSRHLLNKVAFSNRNMARRLDLAVFRIRTNSAGNKVASNNHSNHRVVVASVVSPDFLLLQHRSLVDLVVGNTRLRLPFSRRTTTNNLADFPAAKHRHPMLRFPKRHLRQIFRRTRFADFSSPINRTRKAISGR